MSLWPRTMRAHRPTRQVAPRRASVVRERSVAVVLAAAIGFALPFATAAQEYVPGKAAARRLSSPHFQVSSIGPTALFLLQTRRSTRACSEIFASVPPSRKSHATRRRTAVALPSDGFATTNKFTAVTFSCQQFRGCALFEGHRRCARHEHFHRRGNADFVSAGGMLSDRLRT